MGGGGGGRGGGHVFVTSSVHSAILCNTDNKSSGNKGTQHDLDFPKVRRRILYGAGPLATSPLAAARFAAKEGSLRSPRGRLLASLSMTQRG